MTHKTVVQRRRQTLEVEPDVECARGRDVDLEVELLKTLQHMVSLHLEVLLEGDLCAGGCIRKAKEKYRKKMDITFSCWTRSGSSRGMAASCKLTSKV